MGTTVLVKTSHYRAAGRYQGAIVLGGVPQETEANSGISHLMQRTLLKGTRRHSGAELANHAGVRWGISFSPFTVGRDLVGCSMLDAVRVISIGWT